MRFIRDKYVNKLTKEELTDNFSSEPISEKAKILEYMKSFSEPYAFTTQPVIDVFTNEELEYTDNEFFDGVYFWYKSEIYHFEKYNLKLNDDFIEYVLNKVNK
ncbi:MAG: hypothetical protein ACI4XP_06510 [Acutalibacteraceae bacterium]